MNYDQDFTSNSQRREIIRVGMSGHSKELSMAEITLFNKKMDQFFHKRGLPSGEGFRGIISNEVKNAHKRRYAAENKTRQEKVKAPRSKHKKKGRKK